MPQRRAAKGRVDPAAALCLLDNASGCKPLAEAIGQRHYRVIARAAELAGERLCYELEPALIDAFRGLCGADYKADPGCQAKAAIARALVALDCLDAGLFREGIRLVQREPVWGGSIDTAADVRASCAMGLAASGDPRALPELVELLVDPEHLVRAGAVRAIVCTEPRAAEAVLRAKALLGDAEPEVTGECLRALLGLAPEDSLDFAARFLDASDPVLAELAALALGESRLDGAIDLLRERWEAEPLKRPAHRVWLRAAVLARSDAAFDWLLGLIAEADLATASFLVEALAVYASNARLAEQVAARVDARDEPALRALFRQHWQMTTTATGHQR
jgi:HEAT repeat protein